MRVLGHGGGKLHVPGYGGGKIHVLGNRGGKICVLGHGGGEIRVLGHGGGKILVLGHISKNSCSELKDWFEKQPSGIQHIVYNAPYSTYNIKFLAIANCSDFEDFGKVLKEEWALSTMDLPGAGTQCLRQVLGHGGGKIQNL